MDIRVLGPIEVEEDDEILDLGPLKQRSLLALLVMNANRVVHTDRILEELWGEEAHGKENNVWVYVSGLRDVLEPDRKHHDVLVTKDHGYTLIVDPESIDAVLFERAVVRGRSLIVDDPQAGSSILREALDMWRGTPYENFALDDFARIEITRLEELKLEAAEAAIDADLRRGLSGELVGELEMLHQSNPFREGPASQLMLALYRTGRSADALRLFERFKRGVGEGLGIAPSPEMCRLEEQILLHDSRLLPRRAKTLSSASPRVLVNPYKGLRPFREDDAEDFFGRDRLIAEVVRHVKQDDPLIALVGPSGSGKSSTVRAGVIPALRKGAAQGSENWLFAQMLPGSDPFIELEAALLRSTLDAPENLVDQLGGDDNSGLLRAALRLLEDESSRLVLVIDQFEELFSLVDDEAVRRRFFDHLVVATDDVYGRVQVILTLRADQYGRPLEHAEFGARLGSGIVNVVPLSPDELEVAAMEPARHSGVTFEPAVLAELIADVVGQPGGLPMFQYALAELFDRRVGDVMTAEAYRAMGGVRGALTQRADDTYDALDAEQRDVAQQLFLRLVTTTDNDEWSRRRVHASEIVALDLDVVSMQNVIERFARHRLLSLDRDAVSGHPTVEIAHEALLTEWERLQRWIEGNREDLERHRELAFAANRWQGENRDADYVFSGGRLDRFASWSETSAIVLTTRERDFLAAGVARRTDEKEAKEELLAREQSLRSSTKRRTFGMIAALVALAAVLVGTVWVVTRSEGPKIALVLDADEDNAVQLLLTQGWESASRDFAFEGEIVTPLIDAEESMRALAVAGTELIIDGLFDSGATAYALAAEFPDVFFVVFDQSETSLPNVTAIHFEREGGAFLMGVAAAIASDTGRIGFIGGAQIPTTESRRASYTAGAQSVRPDIMVESVYLGPFHHANNGYLDYELVKSTASEMYRSGVDVIHHSAGSAAEAIPAAADELTDVLGRDLWVIGSEINEQLSAPQEYQDRFVTSMWKRWDVAVSSAIDSFLAGTLEPGLNTFGLANGFVDFARGGNLTESQVAQLEATKAEVVRGAIDPRTAAGEAPTWTREPAFVTSLVFDGTTCVPDRQPAELAVGDVVVVNVVNNSDVEVGVSFEAAAELDFPSNIASSFTLPGRSNGAAIRLEEGRYSASCVTPDRTYSGVSFAARFEPACGGGPAESTDPETVVRAYAAAITARDADAVCSLFAEDATMVGPDGTIMGNVAIAREFTPYDDDRWFNELVVTNVAVSGSTAVWSSDWVDRGGRYAVVGHRFEVENGRIVRWEFGEYQE